MRIALVGGAPGVGKSAAARALLLIASQQQSLVQWIDVDSLWHHQPWEVSDRTKTMLQANLRALMEHAADAKVDTVVVTWVFQDETMQELVKSLSPPDASFVTVQILATEQIWRERFSADDDRPPVDPFFELRYAQAQSTASDVRIESDSISAAGVAALIAQALGLC